jgi:hypothetical protein
LGSWIIGFEIGQQDLDLCLFCKEMMIWGQQHGKTGQNNFMKKITKKLCHGSHMLIKKKKTEILPDHSKHIIFTNHNLIIPNQILSYAALTCGASKRI